MQTITTCKFTAKGQKRQIYTFSDCEGPRHFIWPLTIIVILVHSASHSSMLKSDYIQNKIKACVELIFEHIPVFTE